MAEGVLSEFVGKLLADLASSASKKLDLAWGAKSEIGKLRTTVSSIKAVVHDVEEQQRYNNRQVTHWLNELKDVLYDVDDLLDDLSTDALRRKMMSGNERVKEVCLFFYKSNQLAYSHKMGRRVRAIRERLDAIATDRAQFHFTDRPPDLSLVVRGRDQTHSFVRAQEIIGRDDDKMKFLRLLLESEPKENVSVVPIVGIGGLGKTTLAKMVFNDGNVRDHFELKMWVCISEKFDLRVIVENIIEAATGSKLERDLQMETLQNCLRGNINGKKYLLVLDDVWNEDLNQWLSLKTLLLDGAVGSWIVITTRSEVVARITGTVSSHVLQGLSRGESWSLLKQMACKEGSAVSNDSRIKAIGMEIVDRCGGVPLALRAIGRVLYKREAAEWVKVKNNVHRYITHPKNGIMPILKLSYDNLPPHLKQCFSYCSLIPKDSEFKVKKLIRYWIAQGFIQPSSRDDDLNNVAHEYFMDLLWRSFFQVAYKDGSGNVERFTMHDLMHDLACSVVGTEYCIASLETGNVNERTRHMSIEDEMDSSWKIPNSLLKATRVRSLIQIRKTGRRSFDPLTLSTLMSGLKYLRMLDLSYSDIERLPHSIGELKHLRDLDISESYYIRELPDSLSMLHNLQTLDLEGCENLEKWPRKISGLANLKHLQFVASGLSYMPRGLGKLTCLQTLAEFIVGKRGGEVGGLRELNELNKLEGNLHISSLGNAGIPKPGSTYLKHKLNLKSLELSWIYEENDVIDTVKDERVFESLQPHPNLEKLKVFGYRGSTISSWLSSITNLTQLRLYECNGCKHLPPLYHLSSLKKLDLRRLEAFENVSDTEMKKELWYAEPSKIFFPSLEQLSIYDCPKMKGWWRAGDVLEASNERFPCFPCLSVLEISGCPTLTSSMPLVPSIKELFLEATSWKPLIQPSMKMKMQMKRTTSELAPSSSSSSSSSSTFFPFSRLETLILTNIEELDSLPVEFLRNLTSIRDMRICSCINFTSMLEIEMQKELFSADSLTMVFPSLEKLEIRDCPNLKGWWRTGDGCEASNVELPCIPRLSVLTIERCVNLTSSMPLVPSVRELYLRETRWKPLIQPTMKMKMKMKMTTSESSSSSSSSSNFPPFSKLETMCLEEIEDVDSLPEEFLQILTSLQYMYIYKCINLTSMPKGMHRLNALEHLFINECPQLMERCQKDTGVDWPNIAHIPNIWIGKSYSNI